MSFPHTKILLVGLLVSVGCQSAMAPAGSRRAQIGAAAVAMPDVYSAQTATDILARGGNAVDVTVAVAFTLAVTYPEAGNIAGGGFMNIVFRGESAFLDYRETAPGLATRNMYLDTDGHVIEGKSTVGPLAVGVPGTVAGLWAAHQRYGRLPWKALVGPAIRWAQDGFVVHEKLAKKFDEKRAVYEGRTNFLDYFENLVAGRTHRQPELAKTLIRIAEHGPKDFYRGETARLLVTEMKARGGIITAKDLKSYEVRWRTPLMIRWREYEVQTAPLPSAGGLSLLQLLKMKDRLKPLFHGHEHNSPAYIHLNAEIEKRVFADRAEYLGDPDFVDAPVAALLDSAYLERRAKEVQRDTISSLDSVSPGLGSTNTVHFSVLDHEGNAVANTYTLNTSFGSGVVVPGGGFLLNNEMDDFASGSNVPNYYGLVGDDANAIAPKKRMLSSMSPTILQKDGRVTMVVGAVGGSTIPTSVYQTVVNVTEFGMSATAAVEAPRFHHQLTPPDLITHLPDHDPASATVAGLAALGYRVEPHPFSFGNLQLISRRPDGRLEAASDPLWRGQSKVVLPTHR